MTNSTNKPRILNRRKMLKAVGASAISLAVPQLLHAAANATMDAAGMAPHNILFFFADDMRADCIGALGNPLIKTPHLDRLCKEGLAFNRAYMQGGFHGATCVPSRAMLLTGQSLFHVDEALMRDETWPAAFGRAGYATFMSGKWHNGAQSLPRCFQSARAVFAGSMANPLKAPLSNLENGELTKPIVASQHCCATFADETIAFLRGHKDRPFFAYLPFDAPHDPHIVPNDFPVTYDADKMPMPSNFMPQHPFDNGEMTVRDEKLLPHPRSPEKIKEMLAEYYRYISYVDLLVGRVLDALAASPYAKNTIVVFAADSGVARGSHGLIGKQNLYEHSVRVPMIIVGPGIPKGKTTDALCFLFDVLPTLGARCKVAGPPKSEGHDLTSLFRDPTRGGRDHMLFAYRDLQRAVCDVRWKLIRYPKINKTQLFDLASDPFETRDLASDPAHAKKVEEMMTLLTKTQQESGDTCPLTVKNPQDPVWPATTTKSGKK